MRYQGSSLFDGQEPSHYVRRSTEDDLLQFIDATASRDLTQVLVHSLSNMSQRTNNNRNRLSLYSPHSRGFNLKASVFLERLIDFSRGISVGYIYKFATPVGMVLDHYIRLVR